MQDQRPPDGGPIYAETDLTLFFPEPWNALSSLAILLPAVYWAIKLRGDFKNYTFVYSCIPLLFLGGLGSTLFHAFRSSGWLLLMDVLPTAILTLTVSVYFWFKVLRKVWLVPVVVAPLLLGRFMIFNVVPRPYSINAGYLATGLMIFLPVLIFLVKTKFKHGSHIALSALMLAIALVFRERDHMLAEWLPMGSHFLWHLFSGVGAFFLAQYLYHLRRSELDPV